MITPYEIISTAGMVACSGGLAAALVKIAALKREAANREADLAALRAKVSRMKNHNRFSADLSSAAMKRTLFLQEERIEELTKELHRKDQLLKQKWEGAKQNVNLHVG